MRRDDPARGRARRCANGCAAELSKSKPGEFDLKQDEGGITDIEFLAQYWTLRWSARYPELVTYSDNIRQLESLASIDLVPQETVDVLTAAYRAYRQRLHHLSLEGGSSVAPAAGVRGDARGRSPRSGGKRWRVDLTYNLAHDNVRPTANAPGP